jgi:hypothetical protein
MRFAFVLLATLAASLTLAATPSATIDPSAAYFKIDLSRPPGPPTDVNVLNFPDVQAVSGTVDVGNLPLDADGAVRVTSAPAPARPVVSYELLSGPPEPTPGCQCHVWFPCGCATLSPSVDTTGYSKVGLLVRTNGVGGAQSELWWRWSDDEPFTPVLDTTGAANLRAYEGLRLISPTLGKDVALHVEWYPGTGVESARIYLFP